MYFLESTIFYLENDVKLDLDFYIFRLWMD